MKAKKVFVISLFLLLLNAGISSAQDPILPGEEIPVPSGTAEDNLSQAQSLIEERISMNQMIEDASPTGFVTANGTSLSLNGQEYKFSFANQYYLFYKSENMVNEILLDAKSLGLNAIRTWGFCDGMFKEGVSFQPSAGLYDESGFLKMDYLLYKASEYGLKLIVSFVNNWDDFGGIDQYVGWLLGYSPSYSEHDLFFTNETIRAWYKDYVNYFLNRTNTYTGIAYKDDPTILAWELANEPRAYTDSTGSILNPWINDMAQYIKTIDSNHLVSAGIEGWYGYYSGVDFISSQSSPYVDIATFHLFPDYYGLSSDQALQWIRDRAYDAENILNKPVYIGEFGKMVFRDAPDAGAQMKARNDLYKNIYNLAASSRVDGLGFWLLSGRQDDGTLYPDYDHFTVYYPEDRSTSRVIKSGSQPFVPTSGKGSGKGKKASSSDLGNSDGRILTRSLSSLFYDFYNRFGFVPKNFDFDWYLELLNQ